MIGNIVGSRIPLPMALLVAAGCLASVFLLALPRSASAQGITLTIEGGTGAPGGTVDVAFVLSGDDQNQAVSAGDFVDFDQTVLSVARSDCQLDSRISPTHVFSITPTCGRPNCLDFEIGINAGLGDPNLPLGNGTLLTCTFHINNTAPVGTVALTGDQENLSVNDQRGTVGKLPATVVSGEITVAEATPTPTATPVPTATATPVTTCTTNADCPSGICVSEVCSTVTCNSDTDCPSGICVSGTCQSVACGGEVLCPSGICVDGFCTAASPCNQNSDCPQGQICQNSVCTVVPCSTTGDCPTGVCIEGFCTTQPCATSADCPPSQVCLNQVCSIVHCTSNTDCPSDAICADGTCVLAPPPPTATETPVPTATNTPLPTATLANTATPTATVTNTVAPTSTVPPVPTATATSIPSGGGGGGGGGGCSVAPVAGSGGSLAWLIVPAAAVLWRRRNKA